MWARYTHKNYKARRSSGSDQSRETFCTRKCVCVCVYVIFYLDFGVFFFFNLFDREEFFISSSTKLISKEFFIQLLLIDYNLLYREKISNKMTTTTTTKSVQLEEEIYFNWFSSFLQKKKSFDIIKDYCSLSFFFSLSTKCDK